MKEFEKIITCSYWHLHAACYNQTKRYW